MRIIHKQSNEKLQTKPLFTRWLRELYSYHQTDRELTVVWWGSKEKSFSNHPLLTLLKIAPKIRVYENFYFV